MRFIKDLKNQLIQKYEDLKEALTIAAIVLFLTFAVNVAILILTTKLVGMH